MRLKFFDYVGSQDQTFEEKPFTPGDAVVFSTIANIDLSSFYEPYNSEFVTLGKLAEDYVNSFDENVTSNEINLLKLISHSRRYKDILVSDVEHEIDKNKEKQFGALVFYPTKDKAYVGFAGTGSSVIGYKEDLNMAYMDVIPAQQEAVQYLNKVGEKLPDNSIIGGFSKGGNLAVFASAFCRPDVREKIEHVYSHDGPGFSELITQEDKFKSIQSIVTTYIPQASIVGHMLYSNEDYHIIESTAPPIAQHLPYSWIFKDDDLYKKDNLSRTSSYMLRFQENLLNDLPKEKRKDLIESAFNILLAVDTDDFYDFVKNKKEVGSAIHKTWKEADHKTKKNVKNLLKTLGATAIKSLDVKDKKKKKKKKKKHKD